MKTCNTSTPGITIGCH